MSITYAKTVGAHRRGAEWIKVEMGTRAVCMAAASEWLAKGHAVEVVSEDGSVIARAGLKSVSVSL